LVEGVSQMACERGQATKHDGKERVRGGICGCRGELAMQPSGFGAGRSRWRFVKPLPASFSSARP
jgi:hypothetical protein